MPLIAASPETESDLQRLVWADNRGTIRIVAPNEEILAEIRSDSLVRDIAWPVPDSIYILFENRQLKVIDPDSFAVKRKYDGYCAAVAVSRKERIIGGELRGRSIRAACFLGQSEIHALAYNDGRLEITDDVETVVVPPETTDVGEVESFVAADPVSKTFVLAQSVLSDQQGFCKVSIRLLKYDGSLLHVTYATMANPAATAVSPAGILIYSIDGLTNVRTGQLLRKAEGYPLTAMIALPRSPMRIFGIRSDNSLTSLDVR